MQHLVRHDSNLVIPRSEGIDREVKDDDDRELPAPAEEEVEREAVQYAVDDEVVPVASLGLRDVRGLEEIVTDEVAYKKFEEGFKH